MINGVAAQLPDRAQSGGRYPRAGDLTPLQRAIVLTALYSDLFDFPLTEAELRRYLVADCPGPEEWHRALAPLVGGWLSRTGEYLAMVGRAQTVEVRRERQAQSQRLWRWADRYAGWLGHVPFVRMVAVCGSLAAGNASATADVDVFIVTARGRLWTSQVCAMTLRRIASCFGVRVCPNYFLTVDSLRVEPRTLYTAREVAQAVPLLGADTHTRFLAANPWVDRLLPNVARDPHRVRRGLPSARRGAARLLERALAGGCGDLVERTLYRMLLLYYPRRRAREGWRREHLLRAYRCDRQTVLGGGYGPAIERTFREHVEAWFGNDTMVPELERLFPTQTDADGAARDAPTADIYGRLFAERYGRQHD